MRANKTGCRFCRGLWDPKGRIAGALGYLVMADDNSNYVRESERTSGGEFLETNHDRRLPQDR
jgi:hypothetical protein